MKFPQLFLVLTPLACLLAQTPPASQPATPAVRPPAVPVMPPAPAAPSVPPETVVLTIGQEKITAAQFDKMLDNIPPQYRAQMRTPAGRRQFADRIVMIKTLAQQARSEKLDETPAFKEQLANQTETLLANQAYQKLVADTKADEASEREYYEQHKAEYLQAKVRQILVRVKPPAPAPGPSTPAGNTHTAAAAAAVAPAAGAPAPATAPKKDEVTDEQALAKAQDIRKKLVDGADFATLAKEDSDDNATKANGGDMGLIGHNRLPPAADQVAFTIQVGELSEPIKSPQGYHIIKVEARQEKTFVDVKGEIERKLNADLVKKAMDDLKTSKDVVMNPDFFGTPPPAPAAPAAKPGAAVQPKPESK